MFVLLPQFDTLLEVSFTTSEWKVATRFVHLSQAVCLTQFLLLQIALVQVHLLVVSSLQLLLLYSLSELISCVILDIIINHSYLLCSVLCEVIRSTFLVLCDLHSLTLDDFNVQCFWIGVCKLFESRFDAYMLIGW